MADSNKLTMNTSDEENGQSSPFMPQRRLQRTPPEKKTNEQAEAEKIKRPAESPAGNENTKQQRLSITSDSEDDEDIRNKAADPDTSKEWSYEDAGAFFMEINKVLKIYTKSKQKVITNEQLRGFELGFNQVKDTMHALIVKNRELEARLDERRQMLKVVHESNKKAAELATEILRSEIKEVLISTKVAQQSNVESLKKIAEEVKPASHEESLKQVVTETVKESISSMKEDLKAAVQAPTSYAQVASAGKNIQSLFDLSNRSNKKKEAYPLLAYPRNEGMSSAETIDTIMAKVNPKEMGIKVSRYGPINNGGVVLELGTNEHRDKVMERLGRDLDVRLPKKRRPKVIIYDIPKNWTDQQLSEEVYEMNFREPGGADVEDFKANFRPLFKTGPRKVGGKERSNTEWVVEVSGNMLKQLLHKGRLYHGWETSKVKEHVIIVRCFKCQRFGHFAKDCKCEVDTCGHCAVEGHIVKDCPDLRKPPTCANCKRNKKPHNHNTKAKTCSAYISEQNRIQRDVDYE